MSRKKLVKMTDKVKQFIIQQIYDGHLVEETCRANPDTVPAHETVYRESWKDLEFAEEMNIAYHAFILQAIGESNRLSQPKWVMEHLHEYGDDYKLAFEARRTRLEFLKSISTQMNHILTNRINKSSKLEIEAKGTEGMVQILNYSTTIPVIEDQSS